MTAAMLDTPGEHLRVGEGHDLEPSAGSNDSGSVKGTDTVGHDTGGYNAGKKANGHRAEAASSVAIGFRPCVRTETCAGSASVCAA